MASSTMWRGTTEGIFASIVESYFYGDYLVFLFRSHRWGTVGTLSPVVIECTPTVCIVLVLKF